MIKAPSIPTISVHELKKHYDNTQDMYLIDVRELEEWQDQHIPRALHIPKNELITQVPAKIPELSKPIYLHCRGGVRSLHAASCLLELGYKNVYSVDGGIIEWANAGYPIDSVSLIT